MLPEARPRFDALVDETPAHTAYFCSARCWHRGRARRNAEAAAHPA